MSLDQVHSQLRITPAILESLELADFNHMPLKGHARNMVSSYARFLGLDPNELTRQFLKEYHEFENHMARRDSGNTPFVGYGTGGSSSGNIENRPSSYAQRQQGAGGQGINSMWNKAIPRSELNPGYNRDLAPYEPYDDEPQGGYQGRDGYRGRGGYTEQDNFMQSNQARRGSYSERGAVSGRMQPGQRGAVGRRTVSTRGNVDEYGSAATGAGYRQRGYDNGAGPSTRRRVRGESGYEGGRGNTGRFESGYSSTSYNATPSLPMRLFGALFNNPIALVVTLIVVLVLLFAIWAVAANSCKAPESQTLTPTPAGQVQTGDTTDGTDVTDGDPAQDQPAVTTYTLKVSPASGTGPWTEITVDDVVVFPNGELNEVKTYTVTKNFKVRTAQMVNVAVTLNDEVKELVADGSGFAEATGEVTQQGATGTGAAAATTPTDAAAGTTQ